MRREVQENEKLKSQLDWSHLETDCLQKLNNQRMKDNKKDER